MSCDCVTQLAAAACAPSSRPPRSPSASAFPLRPRAGRRPRRRGRGAGGVPGRGCAGPRRRRRSSSWSS